LKLSRRIPLELLYALLLFVLLDLLPFGFKVILPLFALFLAATVWFDVRNRLAAVISTGLACLLVNFTLPAFMNKTYYRPYERLAKEQMPGFKKYAPNQDVAVENSLGDLVALGFAHPDVQAIQESRPQRFVIDANGYRQTRHASGRFQAVLAGDSFVEGIGNDQDQSLSAQLLARGYDVYNLGHNGDIDEYLASIRHAREKLGVDGPAFLYVFEGNDFAGRNYCVNRDSAVGGFRDFHRALKETHLSRFLSALHGRLRAASSASAIRVVESGGRKIGFLEEYIQAASAEAYDASCLRKLFEANKGAVSAIFFVPEKSRVYSFLLADAPSVLKGASIYAKELAGIARDLAVPFVDLTEPLRAKARQEAFNGAFLYWRDDTHWNPAGIALAAEEAVKLLGKPAAAASEASAR